MAIYMEYDGIQGDVTAEGYQGMIRLDFAMFNSQRAIKMKPGQLANRESGLPKFSVLKTGKKLEFSTPSILNEAYSGSSGKQITLHFVRTGASTLDEVMTCTFANCLPTLYRVVATKRDGCVPVERLYLSYSAIEISQTFHVANNRAAQTLRYGYDLANAKSV